MVRLSVNRAWDDTLAFLKADRRLIVPVLLAFMILPAVLYRLAVPVPDDMAAVLEGNGPPPWAGLLGYALVFISFIGIFTLILLALGRRESLGRLIAQSAKRSLVLLVSMILFFLLLAPLGLLMILPTMSGPLGTDPVQLSPQTVSAIGLWMLLALILLFRIFLLFPATAAEQGGPWLGLKRGWALGRGNGLRLVGTFVLLFLGSLVVSYVINQVGGSVATLALDGDKGMTVGSLLVGLISASASAVFQAIQAGMLASFYRQAVEGAPAA